MRIYLASMQVVSEFLVSDAAFEGDGITAIRIAGTHLSGAEHARERKN